MELSKAVGNIRTRPSGNFSSESPSFHLHLDGGPVTSVPPSDRVSADPPRAIKPRNLALGIERIGFYALSHRMLCAIVFVVLGIVAAIGFARVKVDDSLSQLFRSETDEFRTYEEVTRRFPSNEFDVLIVIEGDQLLERPSLQKLRELAIELQLIDGTRGLISIFSAREPPNNGLIPPPLFPNPLPQGAEYQTLIERVKANEIIRDKMLSPDGKLTLMVLALEPAATGPDSLNKVVDDIRNEVKTQLAGSGLRGELSGVPVMQHEIRNAIQRDRLLYNSLGFAVGCLIAIMFFRRFSFMIIAAGPPLVAILLALGALGWFGFSLNMFLNVMTPLIMVISFSDSMQITFAARDRLLAGDDKVTAFRNALLIVGPACVLTHATAGVSFIALQFSSSDLIRTFGEAGLVAVAVALVAVLLGVPLLGVLLIRNEAEFVAAVRNMDTALNVLRRFCGWIAVRMVARPGLYSLISLIVVIALSLGYAQLQARYRLADQVPDREQAVQASRRLDIKLTGANPFEVYIQFPKGASLYAPETLAVIAEVHALLEHQPGVGNVWSLDTLRRWLAEKMHKSDVETLKQYVDLLPPYLTRRFISAEQDAVIVSGRVPDSDASQLLPIVDRADQQLNSIRAKYPEYKISVTGLSVISARNSANMIDKLSRGLTIEIVFVAAFIGLAFWSPLVMLISILPGLFPIVLAGSVLLVMGQGLQFASVIALTVSFGLGLSATIHFLNRLQIEDIDPDPAVGVERATVLVGPPLILTSAVLACGLAMTVLSSLPSLRLFGWLSAFAMVAALIADLFMLRPIATYLSKIVRRRSRRSLLRSSAE
ncbi:MAG TPA: MMPL family transporter [Gallionella sp.]|nr:MMPL family transporter [Gallionella sp.]